MNVDPWLVRWLPFVAARAASDPVLEIGCGEGADTATLVAAGQRVVAFDRSPDAVAAARRRVPEAAISCRDVREPFPVADGGTGVVIASLTLHYFPWAETEALVARIRAVLRPGGLLLCRLNGTDDHHDGASGHPEIEPDFYLVDGQPKRFFDAASIVRLFAAGWRQHACAHLVTDKYTRPKALWEVVLEKDA